MQWFFLDTIWIIGIEFGICTTEHNIAPRSSCLNVAGFNCVDTLGDFTLFAFVVHDARAQGHPMILFERISVCYMTVVVEGHAPAVFCAPAMRQAPVQVHTPLLCANIAVSSTHAGVISVHAISRAGMAQGKVA